MTTIERIRHEIETRKERSAWERGVTVYALELLDELAENIDGGYIPADVLKDEKALRVAMLNGAEDWNKYSWGGCSLIYDCDIAERLCTPSEIKRTRGGELRPNSREEWLDVQARALRVACLIVCAAARRAVTEG